LGESGINLRALNLVDTGAFGQLRILVSDVVKTRRILMEKHLPAREDDVLAVEIKDEPGSLSELYKCFLNTGVTVLYTYAFVGFSEGYAVMVFRFSDNDRAIDILRENGYRLMNAADFGIL
jgi:hypothetical protein